MEHPRPIHARLERPTTFSLIVAKLDRNDTITSHENEDNGNLRVNAR